MSNAARYVPYERQFAVDLPDRMWPTRHISAAPRWCSVDLRDGNQALARPMDVHQKLVYFDKLVGIGFKEIEIGFPSASETEFRFNRQLVDTGRIPDDVYPQVLTQAREHLIKRTFESLEGYRQAIVHLYNSTSELQRRVVFNLSPKEIIELAVKGTSLVKEEAARTNTKIVFQYSPESFTGTERSIALDVCGAVIEAWDPAPGEQIIINLPATVEMSTPNVYADLIEWFSRNVPRRDQVVLSLHTHNDRGTGVAATELGLLAGGDRVEGTLFGNGERTGNVDLVTVALNLYTQGIDPGLDLSDVPALVEFVQECTEMIVPPRHPYAGELVFTAFSGSHQDAIKKGLHELRSHGASKWEVPYVPLDPEDIGRQFDGIIRINSQSGKGGVAFVMEQDFGCHLPKQMQPEFSAIVQKVSDASGDELTPLAIWNIFSDTYLKTTAPFTFSHFTSRPVEVGAESYTAELAVVVDGAPSVLNGYGNGPIDACRNALIRSGCDSFRIANYVEHARTAGSDAEAVAFIQVEDSVGRMMWGAGIHRNIETASIRALLSAFNRLSLNAVDDPSTVVSVAQGDVATSEM